MVLLDYRCYVPGGKIGNDYPPELTKVMAVCMPSESRHCHSIMRDRYYREVSDGFCVTTARHRCRCHVPVSCPITVPKKIIIDDTYGD